MKRSSSVGGLGAPLGKGEKLCQPLLLCAERSQMRRFRHLVRRSPEHLLGEAIRAHPTSRTCWRDFVSQLAWERLGTPPEELDEVAGKRELWASMLRLLPPRADPG